MSSGKSSDPQQVEEEYEPYKNRNIKKPLSNAEASFHIIKVTFGTGILALPKAVARVGWVLGLILTLIAGAINTYIMILLCEVAYRLCKRFKKPSLTLGEVLEYAIEAVAPNKGKYGRRISDAFLFLYLIWVTCAYVTFMSSNLTSVVNAHSQAKFSTKDMVLIITGFLILLNTIRSLKYLVPVTMFGHVLTLFVFTIIWYYIFRDQITIADKKQVDFGGFANYYGSVLFAIMPVALIMSLENTMKSPQSLREPCGPLAITMTVNTLLTIAIGILGYWKWGDAFKDSITNTLPVSDIISQIARVAYVLCISVDFVLNMFVLHELVYIGWLGKHQWTTKLYWEYLFRALCVIMIAAICYIIPDLQTFINLSGSIAFSFLGLVIPSVSDICERWHPDLTAREKFKIIGRNVWILAIALFGSVIGTTSAVIDVIEFFKKQ